MASKREHDAYGMVSGALSAVLHSVATRQQLSGLDIVVTAAGGAAGGLVGARAPDWIEPATSSWHRSTAHSVAATGAVAYAGVVHAAPLAAQLHDAADHAQDGLSRAASRFLAAATVGAPVGYVSHTLADSLTPRGIPLLTRGF